jgi:hypothetical protein
LSQTYPQDKEVAGTHYWNVLFNSAAKFPDNPSVIEKNDITRYVTDTVNRFTCDNCVANAQEYIRNNPIDASSKKALVKWLCGLKNNANEDAGKEAIDCDLFLKNSLIVEPSCETCSATRKVVKSVIPKVPMPVLDQKYMNVWNFADRYPSLKRAMAYTGTEIQSTTTSAAAAAPAQATPVTAAPPGPPTSNDLSNRYPSLAQFGIEDADGPPGPVSEDLNGILKSLDPMYTLPAGLVGISPSQMNLAYTPEMLSNGVSVITQMYLTNAGSMLTSLITSMSLVGISIAAKNNIANYDRLFIQNVAGSLLFHTMNFMNPRIKGDVLPDLKKLLEGLLKMDVPKIKEALLFGDKNSENNSDAKHLIEMMDNKHGKVDMKKMDLRSTSGNGLGSAGGSLTKDEIDAMLDGGGPPVHGNPTNYDTYADVHKKYEYMLDNEFL